MGKESLLNYSNHLGDWTLMCNQVCGYKNHATFLVAMQFSNEQYWYDIGQSFITDGMEVIEIADTAQELIEQYFEDLIESDPIGLLISALGNVDWLEVAKDILSS